MEALALSGLPAVKIRWAHGGREFRETGIVYYLERGDGAIKIGTTKNLPDRKYSLRRRHGPLTLIAWEYGYYEQEEIRHGQFEHLRISPLAEWFRPAPELMDHVLMLLAML